MSQADDPLKLEKEYLKKATGHDGALLADDVPDEEPRELPEDKEMEKIFKPTDRQRKAEYKIEIYFGPHRSLSWSKAHITFWVSGRMLAGGGDDLMFLCGYSDCISPIRSEHVGRCIEHQRLRQVPPNVQMDLLSGHWAICPACQKAGRNNGGKQAASVEAAGYRLDKDSNKLVPAMNNLVVRDPISQKTFPCLRDRLLVAATPTYLGELTARYYDIFQGNVDIYMKYHPDSIRAELLNQGGQIGDRSTWDRKEELAIYTMDAIVKDTSAGASLPGRFRAFFTS